MGNPRDRALLGAYAPAQQLSLNSKGQTGMVIIVETILHQASKPSLKTKVFSRTITQKLLREFRN